MSEEFARLVAARRGWSAARIALFDRAFALYFARGSELARRSARWPPPRLRHVALVGEPLAVRPYVQLLNTSAWTLYESDVDPDASHPEFAAYLLAHGDHLALGGEVTRAALDASAWWRERSEEECAAFAAASARTARPDAAAFRALADALPWLRAPTERPGLRPPAAGPPALAASFAAAARGALEAYHAAWRTTDPPAAAALADRLAAEAPPLLVTAEGGRIVWDPEVPTRLGALRALLRQADRAALRAIDADLRVVERHTRAFLVALADPAALPPPAPNTEQSGYSYLHRTRRLIAYNLCEPGMERLVGPPLPYARAMLGARTAHEWAHLAQAAHWVPRIVPETRFGELRAALAAGLDAMLAAAPETVRRATRADLEELSAAGSPGTALARLLLKRVPDYQANLVARRFMTGAEKETYVRHNVRTLRPAYPPPHLWRMLIRYLFEYQYLLPALGLTAVADPRAFLFRSTWFDADFLAPGVLDEARFDALAAAVGRLLACYAVDESRFRPVPQGSGA